jgi:uncharacterized pyridoxamine 5'-phosphate oxidase family protein
MTMKKILIFTLLIFLTQNCFSQVYKWRSVQFSSRHNSKDYDWTKWTDWVDSDILIVAKEQRVKVHSSTTQTYDMIGEIVKTYDKENNPIYTVVCVDEEGSRCRMVWYHNETEGSFVMFSFSNLELMYKVKLLD